jgi:hypothetical protein
MQPATDTAVRVGDEIEVVLPYAIVKGKVVELHVWVGTMREYCAHPEGADAELTWQQVEENGGRNVGAIIRESDGNYIHFVIGHQFRIKP